MKITSIAAVGQSAGVLDLAIDFPADARDRFRSRILDVSQFWLAAFAGSKTLLFGGRGEQEKIHLLAAGPAGRAGRFAINSGGTDSVDEISVGAFVAGLHGEPARVVRLTIGPRCGTFLRISPDALRCFLRHIFGCLPISVLGHLHGTKLDDSAECRYPFLAPKKLLAELSLSPVKILLKKG
jgi:hypothetical protein